MIAQNEARFDHNGADDLYALETSIWFSGEPLIVKCIALAILHHMNATKDYAWPSKKRLATMCSVHPDTIERNLKSIAKWIDIIQRKGQSSIYRARLQQASIELHELLARQLPREDEGIEPTRTMREGKERNPPAPCPPRTMPPTRTERDTTPPHHALGFDPTPPHGAPPPPRTMPPRTINRTTKDSNAPGETVNGRQFWAKQLNPIQAKAHEDISREPNGDIRVANGMRCKLEALLKGRATLDVALSMVKGKISPEAHGMWLANRVESVLAEWVLDQEQRDQRTPGKALKTPAEIKRPPNMPPLIFRNDLRAKFSSGEISIETLHANGVKPGSEATYE